ncbi:Uncharacterised protein [Mycobacterium tuberculosis]|nr:Uncharacterised protein [Mycobacterium tuberculosis]
MIILRSTDNNAICLFDFSSNFQYFSRYLLVSWFVEDRNGLDFNKLNFSFVSKVFLHVLKQLTVCRTF